MSESLLESELFGHERGAFTGAHAAKPGLLELADHGTAFIDEVGELSPAAQVKLLRVLEDRRVTRLGATKPVKVDVRFVAATNRDLEADVERGTFRRDLYYRLAGLVLVIPPLRERRDEIPALARSFLRVAAEERRMGVPDIDPRAMQALVEHAWGGNVRELRNVMGRALLLSRGETLLWEHLLLGGRVEAPAIRGTAAPVEAGGEKSDEARRIVEALATCGGNQGEAAKLLGMSRRTLIHRIELYDLPRPRKGRS
jgi:transcriptional regulator with PAS, ATPase and Fis domain